PGVGKHILMDVSGSMSGILGKVRTKLGAECKNVQVAEAQDSSFTRRARMGGRLLDLLRSLPNYSMLIIVSDFQDGAEERFCADILDEARSKHVVIVLESVERYPQPCLHEVAKDTGGHSSVGRIMRK
ncbi:unnamed protein product, partial [Symbiodinium pilosum]